MSTGDGSPESVYFVSLGCPKNLVDSEVMLGQLDRDGHRIVDDAAAADVIVVNTCGFIDAAKEESIETILEMAEHKRAGRAKRLVVAGCLTQRYPDEVATELPEIDILIGSADVNSIGSAVRGTDAAASKTSKMLPVVAVTDTPTYLYDHNSVRLRTGRTHTAYVKIAEGCDRPCGFCIIPKLRGAQRSRSIDSVVDEVEALVDDGVVEVNLVAQDLTRYGVDRPDKPTLAGLLSRVARVDGLRWLRLHYTYPSAFTDELIDVIASEPTICNYIDVPLQHIDDNMLKLMRRGHSARVTRALVDSLRDRIDNLVLRTTFIVGHPGETDAAFDALVQFVRDVRFERVGVFTYSTEHGTASALLGDTVEAEVAERRQDALMAVQRDISRAALADMVGSDIEVLVDGVSTESDLLLEGRFYGQAPGIDGTVTLTDGTATAGSIVTARVTDAADYDLAASLMDVA